MVNIYKIATASALGFATVLILYQSLAPEAVTEQALPEPTAVVSDEATQMPVQPVAHAPVEKTQEVIEEPERAVTIEPSGMMAPVAQLADEDTSTSLLTYSDHDIDEPEAITAEAAPEKLANLDQADSPSPVVDQGEESQGIWGRITNLFGSDSEDTLISADMPPAEDGLVPYANTEQTALTFQDNTVDTYEGSVYNKQLAEAAQIEPPAPQPGQPRSQNLELRSGDTLLDIFGRAGLSKAEAYATISSLRPVYNPRRLKAGQELHISTRPLSRDERKGEETDTLLSLEFEPNPTTIVRVFKDDSDEIIAEKEAKALEKQVVAKQTPINSSLYAAGQSVAIPPSVMASLINVFAWEVDFQRDIHSGDGFEIMYEQFITDDDVVVMNGDILLATLMLRDERVTVYRYEMADGTVDYFKEDGMSVRRALLRTPVDGARMSSGFGMRRHPILGYNKMHQGVDFAAPTGTPVYAAGDGVIERIGRWGSYGKYIRVRHRNNMKTAYAHLNGYARGLKVGSKVKQRQVIGYVGSTGRSTGPHLHYEVHVNDKKVNPASLDLPTGVSLRGTELAEFKKVVQTRKREYASSLSGGVTTASDDIGNEAGINNNNAQAQEG